MIIGKKDKEEFKRLKRENEFLNNDFTEKMYRCDLMNIIKAIVDKFQNKEVFISKSDMLKVERLKIYVTDDILRYGKRFKLIDDRNILEESEDKE